MDRDSLKRGIEDNNKLLEDLITKTKSITEAIQEYNKVKGINDYKLKILDSIPNNLSKQEESNLVEILSSDQEYWKENIPRITGPQSLDPSTGVTKTLNAASGSAQYFLNFLNSGDSSIKNWANDSYNSFIHISNLENIKKDNKSFLTNLFSKIGDEYDIAIQSYSKLESGLSNQYEFGISLRNVLESLNGNLLEKARKFNRSQGINIQKYGWQEMSNALTKNGIGSQEHNEFINEEVIYNTLWHELTEIAKNDKTDTIIILPKIRTTG